MIVGIGKRILRPVYKESLRRFSSTQFVPEHGPVREADIQRLEDFLINKPNILVLTGAGISTESGMIHRFLEYCISLHQ